MNEDELSFFLKVVLFMFFKYSYKLYFIAILIFWYIFLFHNVNF